MDNNENQKVECGVCQAYEADRETTPKERVEYELEELNERIVKLSGFLFGKKISEAKLSEHMVYAMRDQLRVMQEYAIILQRRLDIWDKTDEELNHRCI